MDDACDFNTVGKEEIENEIISNGSASHVNDEFITFSTSAGVISKKLTSFFDLFDYLQCSLKIVVGYTVVNFLQVLLGPKCKL